MLESTSQLEFRTKAEEEAHQDLIESLRNTRAQIQQAYSGFNNTSDSDLIDAYVFEIKALQARYSYLLRQIKELEGIL
jgi:hypothetical protein